MNNHYLPPHKVKRQGDLAEHFTLIPLDNYNNDGNPLAGRLTGFRCLYLFFTIIRVLHFHSLCQNHPFCSTA